ncbi:MAG: hypothetical protein Q8910_04235 [Bacteroidota bacterium]|nr:hypothetical protein [Bacteroidota bacterium]
MHYDIIDTNFVLKCKDLDVALGFFTSGNNIIIQHSFIVDRALIRKYIITKLGTPSYNFSNTLRYGSFSIEMIIVDMETSIRGYRDEMIFFIGRKNSYKESTYETFQDISSEEIAFRHAHYWWKDLPGCPEPAIYLLK